MSQDQLTPPPPGSRRRSSFLLVWLVAIAALVGVLIVARGRAEAVRVLFVGNSYTSYNDLPTMVAEMSRSAGTSMSVSVIAPGGAWLADHVGSGAVEAAIHEGGYDVVVLQEQSMAPADIQIARRSTYPAASALAQMASASGARVVFFQTWGHRGGSREVGHGSYESMQDALTATYADLAIRYSGEVAPVGEAWRAHFRSGSNLVLHDSDGSHPRPEGSYLAAAVIAATIIDESPREFEWYASLDEATARLLLETAERTATPSP